MKIAFVLDAFSMGGIETVAANYIKLLNKIGYKIDVYVLHKNKVDMKNTLPKDISIIALNFDRKICPELYSYGVMKWWWGKYAYAILHPLLILLLRFKRISFEKKSYDIAIAFSGHINDLTFVTENFIQAKQKICWCHGSLLSYLAICDGYSKLYKKIDKIVTLSERGLFSVYAGRSFLYSKKIKNIYNPILIEKTNTDPDHIQWLRDTYKDYTLMIARATSQKDHITAIKSIVELHKRGIKKHIVFLGDGERLEKIKLFAKKLEIHKWCHFEGDRRDVRDYIEASYINILASKFEGLPTVIVEAMACGKPCIMTNSDGGEVTKHGKYGILVSLEDYIGMADGLEKLYTDIDQYRLYCNLSRERYKEFNPKKIVVELEELFRA